jgi:hypothetical protein
MKKPIGNPGEKFGITLVTGLAKDVSLKSNVDNPKAGKAPIQIHTPGLNAARMALGLATKLNIGPSETKVIMNGVKCVKGLTGSPKAIGPILC